MNWYDLLTMSGTVKWPYENTMAFGGLATGKRNAHEALIVAGIITRRGFTPIPSAFIQKEKKICTD